MIIYQCEVCKTKSNAMVCEGHLPHAPTGWQVIKESKPSGDKIYHFCPGHHRQVDFADDGK